MKPSRLFLLIIAVVIINASGANAQKLNEKNVPAEVKSAFQKKYSAAKASWSKEGSNFEAEFDWNKEEMSVVIDPSGNILETEVEIKVSQLPKGVVEYVNTNYKGKSIKEAAKITSASGVITYEAEVKGMDLIFDSNGKFIKEEKD